jgi:XisH protein
VGESDIRELEQAIGQFVFYRFLMEQTDPGRQLLLAVPDDVFYGLFQEPIARPVVEGLPVNLPAFNLQSEVIVAWQR